jgi:hypothetical protein
VEGAIRINVTATSRNQDELALLLVLDNDLSCFWRIVHGMQPRILREVHIVPAALGIHPGSHKFALYAVDSVGTIAQPVEFTVTVTSDPATHVATRSRSFARPTGSRSVVPPTHSTIAPMRSRSPEETPSVTETPTGSPWPSRSRWVPRTATQWVPPPTWTNKIEPGEAAGGTITPGGIVGIVIGVLVAVALGVLVFFFIKERAAPRRLGYEASSSGGMNLEVYT